MSNGDHVSFCEMHTQKGKERDRLEGVEFDKLCLNESEGIYTFNRAKQRARLRPPPTESWRETSTASSQTITVSRVFYSIWTCSWCGSTPIELLWQGLVWAAYESAEAQSSGQTCCGHSSLRSLCESENSALLLSFILTGFFIWAPTSNWQDK